MMLLHVFALLGAIFYARAEKVYGVVYPRLLTARGESAQKVLKINDDIALSLEKSKVFSGDFLLISERSDESIHHYMKEDDYEKNLYHDDDNHASLLLDTEDGVKVEGIINDTLRIKPLLERARSHEGHIAHYLYLIEPEGGKDPKHKDYGLGKVTPNDTAMFIAEDRSSKDTLYPEIHIVVDYVHAQAFNFDKAKITLYLAVLVNAANLRYNSIRQPRIQLRIIGVTVWEREEPFLVIPGHDRNQILDKETLQKFNEYYKDKKEFLDSDLLFMITGRDMAFYENGNLQTWVGGYSFIAGMCQKYRVGMSEDRATSYYGVYVFAHEVGHSLGCVHDGSPAETHVPGHMGSLQCPWSEGYIMSYEMKDKKQYQFSECCQNEIRNLLRYAQWQCLKERKKKAIKKPGWPGQHTSEDNYCKRVYYYESGVYYDKQYGVQNCKVRCQHDTNYYTIGVVDGVPCDHERKGYKRCMLGECVKSNK